jgi:transposase
MENITAVGIDVSKGKSTVTAMRPGGEVVIVPYDVGHSAEELHKLALMLKLLDGEVRVVMEHTGAYYLPVATVLSEAGLFVCVVHAKLIHDFGNNSIRRGKTDPKDAIKIANYTLVNWTSLIQFRKQENTRQELKKMNRQLHLYTKIETALKNNLIALLDQTFSGSNKLFPPQQKANGHEKWVDFTARFWHRECVCSLSRNAFAESYRKWCKKTGSHWSADKANGIYDHARAQVATIPKNNTTKLMITQAVSQLNSLLETVFTIQNEMNRLASLLPEYETVLSMHGVGKLLAPQLIAEIGDVTRFHSKRALTAFAGLDSPPYQSGQYELKERSISKRGSPHLRRSLFRVVTMLLMNQPEHDEVYRFMCKKRAEGKHYYIYMTAASNKFLRRYYGKVRDCLLAMSRTDDSEPTA